MHRRNIEPDGPHIHCVACHCDGCQSAANRIDAKAAGTQLGYHAKGVPDGVRSYRTLRSTAPQPQVDALVVEVIGVRR
jgi:hypothetical protein